MDKRGKKKAFMGKTLRKKRKGCSNWDCGSGNYRFVNFDPFITGTKMGDRNNPWSYLWFVCVDPCKHIHT